MAVRALGSKIREKKRFEVLENAEKDTDVGIYEQK